MHIRKTKYNQIIKNNVENQVRQSYVKSLLNREVDFLLASSDNQLAAVDLNDIYISIPDAEKFLNNTIKSPSVDKILYLVGMTGTGKSIILKKMFEINTMVPHIMGKTLVIPFSFNNYENYSDNESIDQNIKAHFASMIDSSCELIETTYHNIKNVKDNYVEFFECIKTSKGGITQKIDKFPRPNIEKRLENLAKNNSLAFYSSMLKYYLSQDECDLNNVVFIIDDVEGLGYDNEIKPISVAHQVYTCLENRIKKKKWTVNLVIGCRNYVYRLLVRNNYSQLSQKFESYPTPESYYIMNGPTLSKIIDKRYEAICVKEKSKKWKNALDVVKHILLNIDNSIGELILNIEIRNIRNALSTLKELVYNKQWIQRDNIGNMEGAFNIENFSSFSITQANLVRALGMTESSIYRSDESLIPNLIENSDESDLIKLMIIQYFYKMTNGNYTDWQNSFNLEDFYHKIELIYQDDSIVEKFKKSAQYLILKRMLLRSYYQMQIDATPVNEGNVSFVNNVYLSNAAIDLFNYLGKNSILLEMFMDDIWIDNSSRPRTRKKFRGFNDEGYNIALKYLKELIEIESKYIIMARNISIENYELYFDTFGRDYITERLFNGLENSFNVFFKNDMEEIYIDKEVKKSNINNELKELRKKIEDELYIHNVNLNK